METYLYQSPIGAIEITQENDELTRLTFSKNNSFSTEKPSPFMTEIINQLTSYFDRRSFEFKLKINPRGTVFQKRIWVLLETIPFGATPSYLNIAQKYGNAKYVRAIATAIGKNPILIVIPCHRVIGSNGSLVGYASGLNKKRELLEHEETAIQKTLDLFQ